MVKTRGKKKPASASGSGNGAARRGRSRDAESVMGYFRPILLENPKLLRTRSNAKLLQRWLDDHPGEKEVPGRVKQGLSNIKSLLRKKRRRRKRRDAGAEGAEPAASANAAPWETSHPSANELEGLEIQIDECMTLAKNIDREELDGVITLLRRARNQVVWKSGQ
jgi:hypothetical protein